MDLSSGRDQFLLSSSPHHPLHTSPRSGHPCGLGKSTDRSTSHLSVDQSFHLLNFRRFSAQLFNPAEVSGALRSSRYPGAQLPQPSCFFAPSHRRTYNHLQIYNSSENTPNRSTPHLYALRPVMTVHGSSLLSPSTPTSSVSTDITIGHVYVAFPLLCLRLLLTPIFSPSTKPTPGFSYLPPRAWCGELCARTFNLRAGSFPFGLEKGHRKPSIHPKHPFGIASPRFHYYTFCSRWARC